MADETHSEAHSDEQPRQTASDLDGAVVFDRGVRLCPHPVDALELVGIDGGNVYYRCAECDAVAALPFGTVEGSREVSAGV